MTAKLKIAIVGLGRLGQRHAEQLAFNTRQCELVAACSPVTAELEWAKTQLNLPQHALYTDLSSMLKQSNIEAVVLVSPTNLHAAQSIEVLQAGKHLFVEKPLALEAADCAKVIKVAKQYPELVAMVGFVRRFDPSYLQAYQDIQNQKIGTPFIVKSQTCDQNDPDGFFVRFAPSSGGIFMDCSIHDIDLARWFLGKPKAISVYATGTIALHPGLAQCQDVDNGLAIVNFEGGAKAVFYASRTMPHGHETSTEIIGHNGVINIGVGAHLNRNVLRSSNGVSHQVLPDFFARFKEAFQNEMNSFVGACLGQHHLELELDDALQATIIGQAIRESLITGEVVRV